MMSVNLMLLIFIFGVFAISYVGCVKPTAISYESYSGRPDALAEFDRISCETLPSSIHVTKEEHDPAGNVIRSCEGTVMVNKCEGTCPSQLQPSVMTPGGFLKDCQCCRESWMRQREVRLTECYDPDGRKLVGQQGSMSIWMQEPEGCDCHKCGRQS